MSRIGVIAATALVAAACGLIAAVAVHARSTGSAQVRVNAFATVAQRLYRQEAAGRGSATRLVRLVNLIHRFTGAEAVVHARRHVYASARALRHAKIPNAGRVTIAGHRYVVRSFRRTGFGGQRLRISVLIRS